MSNENRIEYPIQTIREGNKITKICVEDFYKMINRIGTAEERSTEKWNEIWDSLDVDVENGQGEVGNGCLIIGKGVSQPNIKDAFDEEIGNNIAFMKAKLNANIKKYNVIRRVHNEYINALIKFGDEMDKILNYIYKDIDGIREFNSEYMKGEFDPVEYEV